MSNKAKIREEAKKLRPIDDLKRTAKNKEFQEQLIKELLPDKM